MKKLLAAVAIAALAMAMLAGPVSAQEAGVGVYQGNASVGESFDDPDTAAPEGCDDSGVPEAGVFGRGLFVPDPTVQPTGVWALSVPNVTGAPVSGALDICGELGPNAAGIGASCGMSQGTGGRGVFANDYKLSNVGWITSAGGTLPVQGDVTHAPSGAAGVLLALTQAQGGSDCALNPNGATNFTVVGVTVLAAA